jgi:hypothetical protein
MQDAYKLVQEMRLIEPYFFVQFLVTDLIIYESIDLVS